MFKCFLVKIIYPLLHKLINYLKKAVFFLLLVFITWLEHLKSNLSHQFKAVSSFQIYSLSSQVDTSKFPIIIIHLSFAFDEM